MPRKSQGQPGQPLYISKDLKYLLSEVGVPAPVQAALFHRGFTNLRLFSGIDETRAEVRTAVTQEIGIDHTATNEERRYMALILSAWETSRTQQRADDQSRAEARLALEPRPVPTSDFAVLREALEQRLGHLRDQEVPGKAFLAAKLEDVETNQPKPEDLREVVSMEDGETDLMHGSIDPSTGVIKVKPTKGSIALPKTPEELRLRHRRIAVTWEMVKTRHNNRTWLEGDVIEAFRLLSDHVLGKHVHGIALPQELKPNWTTVLSYEQEIRKKAYMAVRRGDAPNIATALGKSIKDPEVMNIHFVIPVTTAAALSGARSTTKQTSTSSQSPEGNGGKGAKGPKGTKKLHVKTGDGKAICFKFNNNNKCSGKCGFVHVCQKCLGPHPKSSCKSGGGQPDTARASGKGAE